MWPEERSATKMSSLIIEEWRDLWSYKTEFLIVSSAYLFATTNFLNLPKLVLENGGLAFLSAYGAALLVVVLPILILELAVGQLTGRAPVQALYNISPAFKGVGVSQILFSLVVLATMTRFLAWLLLYTFHLFWTVIDDRPGLPWLNCKNFPELQSKPCREPGSVLNSTFVTALGTKLSVAHEESALNQFMRALENPSGNIVDYGDFQYYILAAQGAVWILVFIAICFGVRMLGKVVSITFILPLILIISMIVRGLLLRGSYDVFVQLYDLTDWNVLADYHVWKLAIEQAVLATGLGFGAFITIGSYNKRSNNLVGDSLLLLIVHSLLTAAQLSVVYLTVGFISVRTGLEPLELLDRGETQMWTFLSYLSYFSDIKVYTGVVLFMAIFVLINVFYLLALNVLSSFEDAMGVKWTRCFPRFVLAFVVAGLSFSLGLYFTTRAGKHAYELATGYMKYLTLWTILAFELLAVSWFYCAHSLGKDLRTMLRSGCCWCLGHFLLFFTYLLPAVSIAIAVLNVLAYTYEAYSEPIRRFEYSELIGLAVATVPLLPIPLYFLFALCSSCSTPGLTRGQKLRAAFRSPMHYDVVKTAPDGISSSPPSGRHSAAHTPRYTSSAPGYVLLPQNAAPLAEPESYNDGNRPFVEAEH